MCMKKSAIFSYVKWNFEGQIGYFFLFLFLFFFLIMAVIEGQLFLILHIVQKFHGQPLKFWNW